MTALGGRYRLDERIATGGMGAVWRATDEVLGRTVAVKVLKDEYADDATFLARFRAEARHAAALTHPGIAAVYDYGEAAGSAFLVMELVPGEALSSVVARTGALGAERTLGVIGQAAQALQAAHSAEVVHRDVKPGNLLVTPDGTVKVTDFGIARAADAVPLTQTGTVVGTAHYLSPEQARGEAVTTASDVYSLGVVAFECLTGRRPFTGDTPVSVALAQVRDAPPPLPEDVPAGVRELVTSALSKEPADRPDSAGEMGRRAFELRDSLFGRGPGHADSGGAAGSMERPGSRTLPVVPPPATTGAIGVAAPAPRRDDTHGTAEVRRVPVVQLLAAAVLALLVGLLLFSGCEGGVLGDAGAGTEPVAAVLSSDDGEGER